MSELSSIWQRRWRFNRNALFKFNPPSIKLLRYKMHYNSKDLSCLLFQTVEDGDFRNCGFTLLTSTLKIFMMVMIFITCFAIKAPL